MSRQTLVSLTLLAASAAVLAQPKPSQDPLLSQSAAPLNPNVMITLDNSGSMSGHAVPEGAFSVNGVGLNFASGWVLVAQGDPFINATASTAMRYFPQVSSDDSGYFNMSLFAMQVFSSTVNRMHYDPTVRYMPWYKPDGTRMPQANPSKPLWDPMDPSKGTYDTTQANVSVASRWCSAWNACLPTTAQINAGTTSITRRWWAGFYTVLKPGASPLLTSSYDIYNINNVKVTFSNGSTRTFDYALPNKPATRSDCVASPVRCTQAEERQNYANWFQYYRSRMLLAKASLSEVVVSSQSSNPRFGFGMINSDERGIDGSNSNVVRVPVREYSGTQRSAMVSDIQMAPVKGSTPLKLALVGVGEYFSRTGAVGNPWSNDPGTSGSPVLACRRSYNILMTDGYYNQDPTSGLPGNVDGIDGPTHTLAINDLSPLPPTGYKAAAPYQDAYANTLADFAMKYYVNDLQPSVPNKVQPISGELADPAYWQHLSQFTVSLGVSGTLDARTPADREATLAAIRAGSKSWPNPSAGNPQKIDDLFHAAVATRGDYFQANNSGELTAALVDAVGRASAAGRSEAGVGLSSNSFIADSLLYVPTYRSGQWFGDVLAYELDPATHKVKLDAGGNKVVRWAAAAKRPAAASRNLVTLSGSPLTGTAFTDTAMDVATKNLITPTATGRGDLINYLRGDPSKEGDGSDASKPYRLRGDAGKLPDFINSPPVLVRNRSSGPLDLLPGDGGTYNAYLSTKLARSKGALFIGGNGGMLHAFDADAGNEVFGYVPRTTLGGLIDLSKQTYGTNATPHRMFVDGPLSEHDANIARGGTTAWRNVLLGSLGAGGKALYAIEAPKSDPTALTAGSVMWEVSDGNMGYMLADVRVGKLKGAALGAGWKAFVGNGIYSSDGSAKLLVIDLATGSVDKVITADSSGGNGLMGVRLLVNDKQEVYAAYAGDLKGNLWRFEFTGPAAGDWTVGFKGKPLFRAVTGGSLTPQPITAPPVVMPHPDGGRVVVAGTGRLIDSGDTTDSQLQSVFGVRDPTLEGESSANTDSPFLAYLGSGNGKDKLQVQTISPSTTAGYFDITGNAVDWETQQGWYMDLGGATTGIDSGARVIVSPKRVLSYAYIDAVVPGGTPQPCETSAGKGYGFMVQVLTGARPTTPIFDTNHDGKVDDKDSATAAGYTSTGDGRDAVQAATGDIIGGDSDDGGDVRQQACMPDPTGFCKPGTCMVVVHSAGEAIPQCLPFTQTARDRIWQQLLNPPTPERNVP